MIVNTVSILWNTILHPLHFPMVCGFFNVWQCYQQGLTDETSCLSSSSVRIYTTSLLELLLGIAKGGFGSSWWIMQKIILWKLENNILMGKKNFFNSCNEVSIFYSQAQGALLTNRWTTSSQMLVFEGKEKNGLPEEKPLKPDWRPTNSTHVTPQGIRAGTHCGKWRALTTMPILLLARFFFLFFTELFSD